MDTENKIGEIVSEYRTALGGGKPMPLRTFATWISREAAPSSISFQAVSFWENGLQRPSISFILTLSILAKSPWAKNFAGDILAALRPELYQPVGEIGKRILANGDGQAGEESL